MAGKKRRARFRGRLLGAMEKRDLINADGVDPQVLRSYGQLYFEAGRFSDAVDFFLRAEDEDGLTALKAHAIEAADGFLLHRIERSSSLGVSPDDWEALANSAERLGKTSVAEIARSRAAEPAAPQPEPEAEPIQPSKGKREG